MSTYIKKFKAEAIRLSEEIKVKKIATQLEILYYTLSDWKKDKPKEAASKSKENNVYASVSLKEKKQCLLLFLISRSKRSKIQ